MIRRRSERVHERGVRKLIGLISCLVLCILLNDAATTSTFLLANLAFLAFALQPGYLAASIFELLPLLGELFTTCIFARAFVCLWQPAPRISRRQTVNEALHLPTFGSVAICFPLRFQPLVFGTLIDGELENSLRSILQLPKHLGNSLFACAETSLEWVRENRFSFHRRQLPKVSTEDNVDTSEEMLLAASFRIHVSAARTAQVAVHQV